MTHRSWMVWLFAAALGLAAGCSDDTTTTDTGTDDAGADADADVEADGEDVEDVPVETEADGDVGETGDTSCGRDEDCDDHEFCTGIERCVAGTCVIGADPCDDEVDCTVDVCDEELDRCSHVGDDEACQDGVVCNGAETCSPAAGCQPGTRPDCRDESACTIDSCDEARGGCVHDPRDLDGDTYMTSDYGCGGDDCNDSDASVHPGVPEICTDARDNDCDGAIDFADVECRPANDTCAGALMLEEGVTVSSSTNGTLHDYSMSCSYSTTAADVVFALEIDAVLDVIVTITSRGGTLYADFERTCGVSSSSMQCTYGTSITLRRNHLEAATYYVIVQASAAADFDITYTTAGPTPIPPNDVCSGAIDIDPSAGAVSGTLLDTSNHYVPGCSGSYVYNDVFYRLVLTEPHRITITASLTPTTYSTYVSLMTTCGEVSTEIACASGSTATITRNFLDAGTYYIAVDANSTNPFTLSVRLEPPIYPPANDRCSGAINVSGGGMFVGTMVDTYRDYPPSCSTTTTLSDVVYYFTTTAPQDVTVSVSPIGASATYVAAMRTTCDSAATEIGCRSGNPAQFTRRSLAAGTYYIIVSGPTTSPGNQFLLTVTIAAPTPVPPGDVCSTAVDISAGGTFTGTTVACSDDYVPSCGTTAAYVDSVYRFTLATPRDVTLALTSAAPTNYLDLRSGACGGGTAVRCVSAAAPSVFNRNIPAGDYWVLIDTSVETAHTLTATFGPPTTACDGAPLINVDYTSSSTFTYTYSGTTAGRPADFVPVSCVSGTGPDMAFRLVVPVRSAVTVTSTTTDFDGALYMRSSCDVASSQIDCDDDCGGTRASCLPSTMSSPTGTGSLTLEAGTYYIIQDAYSTSSGTFTLNVTATRL